MTLPLGWRLLSPAADSWHVQLTWKGQGWTLSWQLQQQAGLSVVQQRMLMQEAMQAVRMRMRQQEAQEEQA